MNFAWSWIKLFTQMILLLLDLFLGAKIVFFFVGGIQYVHLVHSSGGPAVGDIRSRCLRLADESTSEALAVRRLLGHRLPINPQQAKSEWYCLILPPLV